MGDNAKPKPKADHQYSFKVNKQELNIFMLKCSRIKKDPPDLLREIIEAFNDGRLTIKPTPEQKEIQGELYES